MAVQILMPALSPTMEDGTLSKWMVKIGDQVSAGDVIAEIETDKATMEVEAVDEGLVREILVPEGAEGVKVNTPIAVLAGEDDDVGEALMAILPDPSCPPRGGQIARPTPVLQSAEPTLAAPQNAGPTIRLTVREALRDAMAEEMRADDRVFVIGEEVAEYQGAYKITQGLLDEFGPKRVVDTPITEHGFAGLGIGAAFGGLRPIVEFMTFNFAMQAIDQIVNSAAKTLYMSGGQMGCPIVFRGPNGAAARVAAQHSQCYAAWYAHIPGLKVVMPYSAADAKGLLKSAIRDPNPVIFLENEILYGRSFELTEGEDWTVPIGQAKVAREGHDITLISFGIGMAHTLEAADALAAEGLAPEVIDLRTLRPMDTATVIKSVKKTNRCVTVEEGFPQGSISNHLSSVLMAEAFDWLDAPVLNVTGKDVPMPYAANLEKLALVTVPEIIAAAKAVYYK